MAAEVVTLPVVRIERPPFDPAEPADRRGVVDINAWRYLRQRRVSERREMTSLLDEGGAP